MQYTVIFMALKLNYNFKKKKLQFFLTFAQNKDCGFTSEPPQSEFTIYALSKNKQLRQF